MDKYENAESMRWRGQQIHDNIKEEPKTPPKKKKYSLCSFEDLPNWLKDNEFIVFGYRPPLPCLKTCFFSIFDIHTETVNIWTHLIGCCIFLVLMAVFISRSTLNIDPSELWVFIAFFAGAIVCLSFSWLFHALYCHSENMGKLFSKLDYCGISLLIMGSFVPWIYYAFYCDFGPKAFHLSMVTCLGITAMSVSLIDKFSTPEWRTTRAAVFVVFGLSGVCPAIHYAALEGIWDAVPQKSLGWLILQGAVYIAGAGLYAMRVPEKWYPGKFDIWLHSHQIFHVLVIVAAFIHFYGVSQLAHHKINAGSCELFESII